MPDEMTFEAAVIEANRLKSQERMDIDRERMNAAIDKLIEAARFRIPRKAAKVIRCIANKELFKSGYSCICCAEPIDLTDRFCPSCGQAIDWSDLD